MARFLWLQKQKNEASAGIHDTAATAFRAAQEKAARSRQEAAAASLAAREKEAEERRLADQARGLAPTKKKPYDPKKRPRIEIVRGGLPGHGKRY